MSRRWWGLLVVLGMLTILRPALADGGRAAARRAYAEGKRHYDIGEFQAALDAFKRAYLAHEDPVLLYNIAQCHRQLGSVDEALQAYKSYLRKVPEAPNHTEVEAQIAKIEGDRVAEAAAKERAAREAERARNPPPAVPTVEVAAAPPPPARKPLYKKWWLWTIVGGVAAVGLGVGVGVGVGLARRPTEAALPNVVLP